MTNYFLDSLVPQTSLRGIESGRDFSKARNNEKLLPWQVTGLADGEGGFNCFIENTGKGLTGHTVKLEFKVTQKTHSSGILYELQEFFGCGSVVIDNRKTDTKKYHITALSSILEKIIPHFESYPCLTSKFLNFIDWKQIALIMSKKEHLTIKGIEEIKELISKMNKNRSFEDKYNHCKSFLGLSSNEIKYNLPHRWVQGFLTGEGLFYHYLSGTVINPSLELGQNSHDVAILIALKNNGGYIKPKYNFNDLEECKNSRSLNRFILRDTETIIQFVDQYPMLTRKHLDYVDWKKVVVLKNKGLHKTEEGLALINEIVSKMNSKRD